MSAFGRLMEFYNFVWMVESHGQQRLAWKDAAQMRIARIRAEQQAAEQLAAMMIANPSGALGDSRLDDEEVLRDAGLL